MPNLFQSRLNSYYIIIKTNLSNVKTILRKEKKKKIYNLIKLKRKLFLSKEIHTTNQHSCLLGIFGSFKKN